MTASYGDRTLRSYTFAAVDFGASDVTEVIAAPLAGRDSEYGALPTQRGRVRGFHLFNVSEIFAGTTLMAGLEVGDGTDPDLYFASDTDVLSGATNTLAVDAALYVVDAGNAVDIPGDAVGDITLTMKAGTGTPTGIADITVEIEWFGV
jgi:hypothetical protein